MNVAIFLNVDYQTVDSAEMVEDTVLCRAFVETAMIMMNLKYYVRTMYCMIIKFKRVKGYLRVIKTF
jgi:hypothetical protein